MLRQILQFSLVEFRMRDQGTFLGFLWTLLKPLCLFFTLFAVFHPSFSGQVSSFNTYLLSGVTFWDFFSTGTQNGASILSRRSQYLLSSTAHPRVYIIGSILSIFYANVIEAFLAGCFLTLIGLAGMNFALHLVTGLCIALPIVYGCTCILASLTTIFLDTPFLWSLILRIGFFLTPIFYPMTVLSESMLSLVKLNPLFYPLLISRGDWSGLVPALLAGVLLILIGAVMFNRFRYRFAEVV